MRFYSHETSGITRCSPFACKDEMNKLGSCFQLAVCAQTNAQTKKACDPPRWRSAPVQCRRRLRGAFEIGLAAPRLRGWIGTKITRDRAVSNMARDDQYFVCAPAPLTGAPPIVSPRQSYRSHIDHGQQESPPHRPTEGPTEATPSQELGRTAMAFENPASHGFPGHMGKQVMQSGANIGARLRVFAKTATHLVRHQRHSSRSRLAGRHKRSRS